MKNFSSKGIRFSGDSIKSCVGFIDLVDSTKNTITMEGLDYIRRYYSTFINSVSDLVKSSSGRVVKNIGDCLLFYFPKTSNDKNENSFREVIECALKILDRRYSINDELSKQHLPPFNFRISIDYGVVDLALVGDYSQIDLFGSTLNLCSKINSSSSLSIPNEIIIGENFYRILKSFSAIVKDFNFSNNGDYKLTETTGYPTYNVKRKSYSSSSLNTTTNINDTRSSLHNDKQLSDSIFENSLDDSSYIRGKEKGLFSHNKNNNNKRIILVDDEQDILFTYRAFLKDYNYEVSSFTDPSKALNYIRDHDNFNDILVVLDIRMKNLNGFQLHQQIKSIDPTIKILFVTALDILDELLSIVPGVSKDQIMRKPVDRKIFTNTVKKLIN
ncbi:MAG: response regulator [Nitrososphaeraceae archaeon]|nr:response regulator [Nitrososphaeraceae archaeon]